LKRLILSIARAQDLRAVGTSGVVRVDACFRERERGSRISDRLSFYFMLFSEPMNKKYTLREEGKEAIRRRGGVLLSNFIRGFAHFSSFP